MLDFQSCWCRSPSLPLSESWCMIDWIQTGTGCFCLLSFTGWNLEFLKVKDMRHTRGWIHRSPPFSNMASWLHISPVGMQRATGRIISGFLLLSVSAGHTGKQGGPHVHGSSLMRCVYFSLILTLRILSRVQYAVNKDQASVPGPVLGQTALQGSYRGPSTAVWVSLFICASVVLCVPKTEDKHTISRTHACRYSGPHWASTGCTVGTRCWAKWGLSAS